jgi:hypothetical protein
VVGPDLVECTDVEEVSFAIERVKLAEDMATEECSGVARFVAPIEEVE